MLTCKCWISLKCGVRDECAGCANLKPLCRSHETIRYAMLI